MFTFKIKENEKVLEIVVSRALLLLSALACLTVKNSIPTSVHVFFALIFISIALFMKKILANGKIGFLTLLFVIGILLAVVTGSIISGVILFAPGLILKLIYKQPTITFSVDTIVIKKTLLTTEYGWHQCSHVVLKDDLLTLDFSNNKMLQLYIDNVKNDIDEIAFNQFSATHINLPITS